MNEEFLVGLTGEFWTEIQGIENTINKVLNLVAQSFAVELCRFWAEPSNSTGRWGFLWSLEVAVSTGASFSVNLLYHLGESLHQNKWAVVISVQGLNDIEKGLLN